ncbi:MAG TPA: glycoside hydrolase family 3 N-terminal domain-containing protein [Ktedonobacteraceae bacterium]|nr:glycoside hydrolase family 3 N-terminal domain-containing protein [Ktedonobacteraceae bacterium]
MSLLQPPPTDTQGQQPRRFPKRRSLLAITLAGLTVLLILAGFLGQRLFLANSTQPPVSFALPAGQGPYVTSPLNAQQINEIRHLSGYMKYRALASLYASHMTLDEKIGQLIMLEFNETSYSDNLDYAINTLHVGGVIMYQIQLNTFSQAKNDIAHMQNRSKIPLMISIDQEGGIVNRLERIYGPAVSATDLASTGDPNAAAREALKTSQRLKALGINVDLAPDVDVNVVNGYDMIDRTFGNTPEEVLKYATPYIRAMQGNGTIACIKHFPGLGDAPDDVHDTFVTINSSKKHIYDVDLAPFKALVQSSDPLVNPGMVMPTNILMPAIDPKHIAELSYTFITGILRNEFHYDGVVMTDALYMDGMDRFKAAVEALQAGDDMILGPNDSAQAALTIQAIKDALNSGQLTMARIDEAVTRILALKMQYHIMPTYEPGI